MNKNKKWIGPMIIALALAGGGISGCLTTGDGSQGIEVIEGMTDAQFTNWKLYIQLGIKVGTNRMVQEGMVTQEDLNLAALTLEAVRDQPITPGATAIIAPALEEAGLTGPEVELLVAILEQELLSRGALDWIDPETGLIAFSPRTKELLTAVAAGLRSTDELTDSELEEGKALEAEYNGKLIE